MSTTHQTKAFLIRNFGDDREYDDLDSVLEALKTYYRGKSVALHVIGGKYRMVRPFFLDVGENGELYETYADQPYKLVDTSAFRRAAVIPEGATP